MSIQLLSPVGGETVSLFTDAQRAFRAAEAHRATLDGNLSFKWYNLEDTGSERSTPAPVRFVFEDDEEGNHYIVLVSEWEDLRDPHTVFTTEKEAFLYNLKAGARYYWCVQKDGVRSPVSSFVTALDLPRCVKIDGVSNVRDFGGYYVDGGRIRQGLLYRGSEFEIHTHLSTEGANELRALGIRTDLDLRGEVVGKGLHPTSALFGMKYVLLPAVPYCEVFAREHKTNTRRFFMLLAKKSAYPIYFHCWGGADRTGTLAFLLGAFLGMKKEDLIYEYEFTSLSRWGTRTRNYPPFIDFIAHFEALTGDTYKEKARFFLQEVLGISLQTLTDIEKILIESKKATL